MCNKNQPLRPDLPRLGSRVRIPSPAPVGPTKSSTYVRLTPVRLAWFRRAVGNGGPAHHAVDVGLLAHGVAGDHPDRPPAGDLARRPDIAAVLNLSLHVL